MNFGRHILLDDASAGTVRFLSGIHVTLDEGKTQSWVTVTRTGTFRDPRYGEFEISRQMLLAMVENFDKRVYGQDVFFDVAHKPNDGAAGKVLKLKVEGDRLRALVDWTPYGIDFIKNKGHAYSSIEYNEKYQDNETGTQYGPVMMGAALVMRPCIKRLDPIQLSEASGGDVPTLMHPELQTHLLQEIQTMHKLLAEKLKTALAAIIMLSEPMRVQLLSAFETAVQPVTDEVQAKALMEVFANSGKQLAEQIAAGNKDIKLSLDMSGIKAGLTADDVKKLMEDEEIRKASATLLRKIESFEQERASIVNRWEAAETATKQAKALREIEEKDVRSILGGIADNLNELDRDELKEILSGLIDRIVFDFSELECCIHYKIPLKSRDLLASPTRFELVLPP